MYRLAISPCPNDTFAFYGLIHGKTDWTEPLDLRFADIEELNRFCFEDQADFCKISFHTYLLVRERYSLLETGSALGFGCGPLLVARTGLSLSNLKNKTIAVPGRYTTAALLLGLLLGRDLNTVEMRFDHIMPAVEEGRVDAGLIIHESRFTYGARGLVSLVDLGVWWERESGFPIPLGGIVAHRRLGEREVTAFDAALGQAVDYAWAHPEETYPFMQEHAREMDMEVMKSHVALYVNRFTRRLGAEGRTAIEYLVQLARKRGLCQ